MSNPFQQEAETLGKVKRYVGEVNRKISDLREALKETNEALSKAFLWEDVPTMQHMYEVHNGRWDGVRAIVERNEDLLKD